MLEACPVYTLMQSTCKLTKTGFAVVSDPSLYKSVVGALQYATLTRPDIAYSINKVWQFMSHHLETHWVAFKRILRYLKSTMGHGSLISPMSPIVPPSLHVYYDVDWVADQNDRRSASGVAIYFGNNLIFLVVQETTRGCHV